MHPIERLRYVARAEGAGPSRLVREAAGALAGFGTDAAGLVTACRRLLDRHPAVGPMWWLAARMLTAGDPVTEAWRVSEELEADATPQVLASCLPDEATVVTVGWAELLAEGAQRRGDLGVLLVSSGGEAAPLARRLRALGVEAEEVPDTGTGAAAAGATLVALEATALGPDGFLGPAGSRAAAAVARQAAVPVWIVAGTGRALPGRLWAALKSRLDRGAEALWQRTLELVPLSLADRVVWPDGLHPASETPARIAGPVPPELLRPIG